jgi:hypothetical protein
MPRNLVQCTSVCWDRSTTGTKNVCTRVLKLKPCILCVEQWLRQKLAAADTGACVLSAHSSNSSTAATADTGQAPIALGAAAPIRHVYDRIWFLEPTKRLLSH